MDYAVGLKRTPAIFASLVLGSGLCAGRVDAQGCEPIRFSTPVSLGGDPDAPGVDLTSIVNRR